ncbi:beta-ketoacyl synthase N-terminal-like domain-containing protein [Altibacter sp. HG106]|uniref:beta-ketoacyl synthase N-terminal-like domain-containing protein n=1 Tax=Altibacter sp. HG106 TaxID=3023937 RepID=UPI00234FDC25|nr:beta-ketoacyl synthase N-terminal-like domain-containing protein [Altibacter sp. HG106]MDC7994689.1 beta-ketoacyl synthase N-terminal-like domain-containing protein [Altibacter sp. HG106]
MKKVYIQSTGCISAQQSWGEEAFLTNPLFYETNVLPVVAPDYKQYISAAAARRMAKAIKMGVTASHFAMKEAGVENVDAIITGTGLGLVRDSEKFVSAIIENGEQYLTPTAFIQSTHNTVAGQIALGIDCKGYNLTYVHDSNSFESALLDSIMQLQTGELSSLLVGGVDELWDHTVAIHQLIGHLKEGDLHTQQLRQSKTSGTVFAEGAGFFVLESEKKATSYAEIVDVELYGHLSPEEVNVAAKAFLKKQGIAPHEVDVLLLGTNGDIDYDGYYHQLCEGDFAETSQAYYKHLSGEFHTATAFGTWVAAHTIKSQILPEVLRCNDTVPSQINTVLLYDQYRGENHSFILFRKC